MKKLLYVFSLLVAFLLGIMVDRIYFGRERGEVLKRYDQAVKEWRQLRTDQEKAVEAAREQLLKERRAREQGRFQPFSVKSAEE